MSGAPNDNDVAEIQITPEMIEAGIEALYRFNISEPTRPEIDRAVEATFRAMYLAHAEDRRIA